MKHNLDTTKSYKLIEVHYGKLEFEGKTNCDNCDRLISNQALIQDNEGHCFGVGLDCMETLTGIKDSEKQKAHKVINSRRKIYKLLTSGKIKSVVHKEDKIRLHYDDIKQWNVVPIAEGEYEPFSDLIGELNIPVMEIM